MKQAIIALALTLGLSTAIEPFVLNDDSCVKYETTNNKEEKTEEKKVEVTKEEKGKLDEKENGWSFLPSVPKNISDFKEKYGAYYEGDNKKKELYLTFDCGYEIGVTNKILDVLKKNNVKAAFFVTGRYVSSNPKIVKRMQEEGHIVGNHTENHPSLPQMYTKDKKQFEKEIKDVEKKYKDITGKEMDKYLRPPMGSYSEASLAETKKLGYKSIFWNCAYKDYDTKNQPNGNNAKKVINERFKDGGIVLLHATSKTNSEILDDLIKEWKTKEYEFKTLKEI